MLGTSPTILRKLLEQLEQATLDHASWRYHLLRVFSGRRPANPGDTAPDARPAAHDDDASQRAEQQGVRLVTAVELFEAVERGLRNGDAARAIASVLDPATRTARVRCSLANEGNLLKPEMYATVSIATSDEKALALPREAVIRLGDQTMVFVEGARSPDGRTELSLRPVTVEESDSGPWVVVQRGVEKGTRVVVSGASLLASRSM